MEDLVIPFVILTAVVIYLILSRARFESDLRKSYDELIEKYKQSAEPKEKSTSKELVGLVFQTDGKLGIETLKSEIQDKLSRGKFEVKDFEC
jgi:hypothetical protein